MKKICFVLMLLMLPCVSAAASIPLPVYNNSDTDLIEEYVFFGGVPIGFEQSTNSIRDLKITSDMEGNNRIPAQFDIISRYDTRGDGWQETDRIRTVLCTFKASVDAGTNKIYYLQIDRGNSSGGNAPGTDLGYEDSGHQIIDTGSTEVRISKTSGTLFDRVTLGGARIIDSPAGDGIFLVSDADGTPKTFVSHNTAPDEIKTIYNGPLFCLIEVTGKFTNELDSSDTLIPSGGPPVAVNPVKYTLWYYAFKDDSTVYVSMRLKNENPGNCTIQHGVTNRNLDITNLYLSSTLNGLAQVSRTDFGSDFSDTDSPSGEYVLKQRHCLPGSCAQASEDDSLESPNFTYNVYENGSERLSPGPNGHNRFDSYSRIGDGNNGLMIALEYHWQNWPLDIMFNASTKQAQVHLLPDTGEDHIFLGGAWKLWTMAFNFHGALPDDYSFDTELSNLKNPLKILLGNQVATSRFYADRTFPSDLTLNVTMPGGEDLDLALEAWQDSIRAQHNSDFSQNTYMNKDMTDVREARPVSSTEGAYNGPVDMYGWLRFGDWVRGISTWGMGALNYAWNYIFVLNGHRFQTYDMLKMGEQMSLKTVDSLMLHMAIDDGTTINASGASVRRMHGGHRGEMNASTAVTNYVAVNQADTHSNWKHGFPHGAIIEYMLTGKPWLREGLNDLGDFIRFGYSKIPPDHGLYVQTSDAKDCVTSTCSYWRTDSAMRSFVRSLGAAVGLYQATGDTDYLVIAKAIFSQSVLGSEGHKDGVPQGYCDMSGNDPSFWGSTQSLKYTIMLYYLLEECSETEMRSEVMAYLGRLAGWIERTFETLANPPGTYSGDQYMAHAGFYRWNDNEGPDYGWSGGFRNEYVFELSDLFAFKYKEITRDPADLTRARQIFQDSWFYSQNNGWEPVRTSLRRVSYANDGPAYGHAWLKEGKVLIRPMYWPFVEWEEQQSACSHSSDMDEDKDVDGRDLSTLAIDFNPDELEPMATELGGVCPD